MLERGLFTATPALTYLNLMRNSLETVTLHTIQPLMNNLVNHTSMLLIKGNLCFQSCSLRGRVHKFMLNESGCQTLCQRLMAFASATQSLNLWTLPLFLGLINYSSFRLSGKPTQSPLGFEIWKKSVFVRFSFDCDAKRWFNNYCLFAAYCHIKFPGGAQKILLMTTINEA